MRQILIILTFSLASIQSNAYNPFWINADKKLITAITNLDKNNPKEIEQYFKNQRIQKCDSTKENLGFGWKVWSPGIGSGYIAISAIFYYYNDSIVSYSMTPQLPEEKGLFQRYKKWYKNYFEYSDSSIQTFRFNESSILKPLKEYEGNINSISSEILNYMAPNSGTMYGYAGGGIIQQNRTAFDKIKSYLTNEELVILLYSINPASRFTAIEYYWKHKERFGKQESIDEWIEQNFKEIPTFKSTSGCFAVTEETRSYVYMHSLMIDK